MQMVHKGPQTSRCSKNYCRPISLKSDKSSRRCRSLSSIYSHHQIRVSHDIRRKRIWDKRFRNKNKLTDHAISASKCKNQGKKPNSVNSGNAGDWNRNGGLREASPEDVASTRRTGVSSGRNCLEWCLQPARASGLKI